MHLGGLDPFSCLVTQEPLQVDHVISPQSSFVITTQDVGLSWTHEDKEDLLLWVTRMIYILT